MSWNTCQYPDCENWTYRPDVDYCETHRRSISKESENEKKQVEKRNSQIAKAQKRNQEPRKLPSKVSEKRKELNKEYFKLVEQFKKDNPECKAKVNEYCTGKTTEPHHKRGRNEFLLDTSTWLATCRSCHSYIEGHPKEAKEKGWSESRLATTETP